MMPQNVFCAIIPNASYGLLAFVPPQESGGVPDFPDQPAQDTTTEMQTSWQCLHCYPSLFGSAVHNLRLCFAQHSSIILTQASEKTTKLRGKSCETVCQVELDKIRKIKVTDRGKIAEMGKVTSWKGIKP